MALSPIDSGFFETACVIIRAEPALATQVLKIANSALFASQAPVTSIDRAVIRIGARMISTILAEGHLQHAFSTRDDVMGQLWLTNSFAANMAQTVTLKHPDLGIIPEVAYTFGLLHDVGRLVLVALYKNASSEVMEENPHPQLELIQKEEVAFGVNHMMAGRLLGNRWKLPAEITLVVAAHHTERSTRTSYPPELNRAIDLMALVDEVVHLALEAPCEIDEFEMRVESALDASDSEAILEPTGLSPRQVVDCIRPALGLVEKQKQVLGIRASRPLPTLSKA